jgi:hypothetical protein
MAICPFADWKPITANSNQPKIRPVGLVLHTAVSNSDALRPWSDIEWTFYVGEHGELTQYMDTEVRADCQRDGNSWVKDGVRYGFLSVETWDGAGVVWDGKNTAKCPKWTPAQVATLAKLAAWLHQTHGIELVKATGVHGKGIGWHSQYTAPDGQLRWNKSHACPAAQRIAQFPGVLKAMQDAAKPAPKDDMPTPNDLWRHKLPVGPSADRYGNYEEDAYEAEQFLVGVDAKVRQITSETLPAMQAKLEHLDHQQDERHKELWTALSEMKAALARLEAK